ncbi:hypothetical protein O0L34_g15135 [Tuta absoluta]|nr:hypothetical protein O0L34_g15135 [Tuta absoluta]
MSREEPISKEASQAITNFLKSSVPKSDVPNIDAELKKDFVLSKTKGKKFKKKAKKKKANNLTRKEKKGLGFYAIPRDGVKYKEVEPINQIWNGYMNQILELEKSIPDCTSKTWDHFTQSLYKADLHGALLTIIRSKCPSYVGKTGICIMDTRNTFKIVSKDNVITTIPKRECVFEMSIKNVKITLFGKHFCVRPAERSTKKVKSLQHPDL